MQRIFHAAAGLLIASALTCRGHAAVVEATANGFAIEQTVQIAATPAKVYDTLIRPALWWDKDHTYSHSATNLSLQAHAGGCFCETMPRGGSVEHARVVVAEPGEALRLRGPLGPFQGQGVDSALTFTLKANGAGTELDARQQCRRLYEGRFRGLARAGRRDAGRPDGPAETIPGNRLARREALRKDLP